MNSENVEINSLNNYDNFTKNISMLTALKYYFINPKKLIEEYNVTAGTNLVMYLLNVFSESLNKFLFIFSIYSISYSNVINGDDFLPSVFLFIFFLISNLFKYTISLLFTTIFIFQTKSMFMIEDNGSSFTDLLSNILKSRGTSSLVAIINIIFAIYLPVLAIILYLTQSIVFLILFVFAISKTFNTSMIKSFFIAFLQKVFKLVIFYGLIMILYFLILMISLFFSV